MPFEGGLECRPEDRAAPALAIELTGRVFHRHALHHRELVVAAMRELAHQELGMYSPVAAALKLAVNALVSTKRRRRVVPFSPSLSECSTEDGNFIAGPDQADLAYDYGLV